MANKIDATLYYQLENKGSDILQFKGIIDHKKNGSHMTKETGFTVLKGGQNKCNPTTRGWKVLVQWRDETTTWMDLTDVKEDNPIGLAEYEVANKIDDDPYFAWSVNYVLKKQDRIIANKLNA